MAWVKILCQSHLRRDASLMRSRVRKRVVAWADNRRFVLSFFYNSPWYIKVITRVLYTPWQNIENHKFL